MRVLVVAIGALVVLWALVDLAIGQAGLAVHAPRTRAAEEVLATFARFFAALVLFLLPAEEVISRRLRWVAGGLLVLGLGTLMFGYLEPLLEGGVHALNQSMYRVLATHTLAGVLFATGLLPKTPPRFSGRTVLVVLAALLALAVAFEAADGALPRLFFVAESAGPDPYPPGRPTAWHWALSAAPVGLAVGAAIGVWRGDLGGTLGVWLTLAMVLFAGSQVHQALRPSAYGPVLTSADLLRLACTVVIVVGGVLEFRRVVAERSAMLAGEREAKARYRALVEQAPAVTYTQNPNTAHRFASLYVSPQVEGVLGYAPEEFASDPGLWARLLHPEDRERVLAEDRRMDGAGESFETEYRMVARDGRVVWIRDEAVLVRDEDGRPVCWQGVMTDVTERRRADDALKESEERFRSLVQNSSDIIAIVGSDGVTRYVSPSVEHVLGYKAEDRVGESALDLVHEGDVERVRGMLSDLIKDPNATVRGEFRIRHADGSIRHAEAVGTNLIRDPSVGGIVVNYRDVTRRKEAEARVREAEIRYRSLVETVPAVTYVDELDEISTATYMSPQVESMLGFTAKERLADPELWVKRLHPEDRERVLAENGYSNETGEPFDMEYRMIARDGSVVWVRDASVVVRDEQGRPSYRQGVMFDVTDRKRTQERLAASETRLRTVIEQSPLGIHIFAPDGTSLLANSAWDRLLCLEDGGWPESRNVFEDEQLRATGLIPYIEQSLADASPVTTPPLLFDPAGHGRAACWLRALLYPVKDGEGRILEVVLLLEDVTGRKEAAERLEAAEQRYRTLVEQVPAVVYVDGVDDANTAIFRSAHVEEVLGYTPEEFASESGFWQGLLHPEDRERVLAENARTNETGEPFKIEYRMVRKDGSVVWVRDEAVLVRGEGDEPLYWHGVFVDVTERKEAERALRESEMRLRTVVENTPVVLFALDAEGVITVSEGRGLEALGRMQTEMVGRSVFEVYEDEPLFADYARRVLVGEDIVATVDLHGMALEIRCSPLRENGGISGAIGVAMDVTRRKKAEEQTRFQAQLLEQVQAAVVATDVQGTVTHWNEHAERMYGWSREEALGRNAGELMVGPLEAEVAEEIMERLRAGELWEGEFTVRRKDGSTFPVFVTDSLIRDAEGRVVGIVGVSTDVTERKRAERELRLRDRAIEASPNGIVITDPNAHDNPMVYVNPGFERMSGYPAEELMGRNCRVLQGPDRDQPVLGALRSAIAEHQEFRGVLRNYKKDGSLFYNELHIAPVFDGKGRLANFVGITTDVTERERLQQEMEETNRRLGELASLRAGFAAMVAHEIGAPLATIRGFAEMMETGELGPDEQADVLAKIGTEIEGLSTLVADVRSAAAVEREDFSLVPRPVPVSDLLEAAARFAGTLPGEHPLVIDDNVADGTVRADPYRIGQVLRNLLSNAAKYSPEGAPIRVATEREDGRVRLEVSDRGRGVHPGDAGLIFEKFGRGRDANGSRAYGVGLGLYVSRRIVRAHGGELSYRPAPRGGSVFSLDLEIDGGTQG